MAEIMLLLVFCLLIAMATYLRSERSKLDEAKKEIERHQAQSKRDQAVLDALRQNPALSEKIVNAAGADAGAMDEFWRDLVDSKAAISELRKDGSSLKEIKDKAAAMTTLQSSGIDLEKALRDAEIVAAMKRAMPDGRVPSPQELADLIGRGSAPGAGPSGHNWPPIITLSEAGGYYFKTGSAELAAPFRNALLTTMPDEILRFIEKYDVDVIEVVGHTDEQTFGVRQLAPAVPDPSRPPSPVIPSRQSNLDRDLATILRNGGDIARLTPVDNAGLGLARAVSVVSVLRQSPKLANYKMIPLSGAQLINTDETLALSTTSGGDVAQRRRIEIRLRKSVPHEAVASILPPAPSASPARPRQPRPKAAPLSIAPGPRPMSSTIQAN
ncbi:hypothetical protein XH90_09110 [Bradyrhizobium sp. CCBAU 53338]|nr:hypothetical protein XH90_09110 [Bradyrhizobium sp. CCBAU 53338]